MTTNTVNSSTTTYIPKPPCHSGNVRLTYISGAGGLYVGGWSRGAHPEGFAVIDLTGKEEMDERKQVTGVNAAARETFAEVIRLNHEERALPWLSFPIKDFGVPTVKPETWDVLAEIIRELMVKGVNVLVCCQGGHGRTGVVSAILCWLLIGSSIEDPVKYVRKVYCDKAVETYEQHKYVNRMCGLPEQVDEYKVAYSYSYTPRAWTEDYHWQNIEPDVLDDKVAEDKTDVGGILHYNELIDALDAIGAYYEEWQGLVTVCVASNGAELYFDVVKYDDALRSVYVIDDSDGERWINLEALATTLELNQLDGKDMV